MLGISGGSAQVAQSCRRFGFAEVKVLRPGESAVAAARVEPREPGFSANAAGISRG
ncbi:hypothetical protein [Candidatus Thiosymbion oneisti]|uniref:hypothetical protein n=1 Tax=Candidatus Thiosymbion oneisti TaxID=589554 RepID=UPI0013FDF5BF|nr:hypothetical protein [Candidatus Thiosymbion oneisti]